MLRSFLKLQEVDPGFNSQRVIAMQMQLPNTRYREPAQFGPYFSQLLEGVTAANGVEAAALVSDTPLDGGANFNSFQMRSSFGQHESKPGKMQIHASLPPWVREELSKMGYELEVKEKTSGPINAIYFDRAQIGRASCRERV